MTNLEYIIYEAEANGEISIDTRDEMLSLITEKKTKAEYRKQKFLKKHEYDQRNGTIKINGRRMHFNDIGGSTKYNEPVFARSAYKDDPENNIKIGINMNTAAFNTKHPTTHEFIAQHEAGHRFSKSHNRKMMRREWDDDERFDTENLEDMIRRQILEK